MIRLSLDSLTGFSTAPLRLATFAGLGGAVIAVLLFLYTLIARSQGHTVAGWTSTVAIVSAFGAVQLVCVGILGEYIGRMYAHMQGRPTYFIAYDSLTTEPRRARPTDTPLPADPAEGHIRDAASVAGRPATEPAGDAAHHREHADRPLISCSGAPARAG